MTLFKVKAATESGKVVYKDLEALDREELGRMLSKEGLYPLKVSDASSFAGRLRKGGSGRAKKDRSAFLAFNKGFISLLKSGMPVIECLETLTDTVSKGALSMALPEVITEVRGGSSLSVAMSTRPDVFTTLYTASISAGERTGDLIPSLESFVQYQKRVEALRKKVVSAVTYPAILFSLSFLAVAVLLIFVVPSIAAAFSSPDVELHVLSRALFALSFFIRDNIIILVILFVVFIFLARMLLSRASVIESFDNIKLRLPLLGGIFQGYSSSKFARTLAMVLTSGVNMITALQMSSGVLGNQVLEGRLKGVIKSASEGGNVGDAMSEAKILPELAEKMFSVGEKSANLENVLLEMAEYLEEELDHKVALISDMIEPVLIIMMGILIATIIVFT
ncbi:MAG: type II secretion system F family protein, partial [Deltaproteobacteria bacterium]|nr:type II secretion system F family protein [Deltaproteobacteria bacterium]